MENITPKRRGRPKKAQADARRASEVPVVSDQHAAVGQVGQGDRADDHGSGDVDGWQALTLLAEKLCQAGRLVPRIHYSGTAEKKWQWWDQGCTVVSGAGEDCVITSDGHKHQI